MSNRDRPDGGERPLERNHKPKIAILVLSSLGDIYTRCTQATRSTWAAEPSKEVDIFFVYGAQNSKFSSAHARIRHLIGQAVPDVQDGEVWVENDIILCGCSDHVADQSDCLLRKRLIAFDYLANHRRYDFIYTVCASSYVDTRELAIYVRDLPLTGVYHGPLGVCVTTGYPFVSGTSILMSRDIAAFLAGSFDAIISFNDGAYADDVTIGYWIAEHYCEASISEICAKIHIGEQGFADQAFVLPYGVGMINFVHRPVEEHLPKEHMYHYHFHSWQMWQMESFHWNFFYSNS